MPESGRGIVPHGRPRACASRVNERISNFRVQATLPVVASTSSCPLTLSRPTVVEAYLSVAVTVGCSTTWLRDADIFATLKEKVEVEVCDDDLCLSDLGCLPAETMMVYARRKAPTLPQSQIVVVENVAGRSSGWPEQRVAGLGRSIDAGQKGRRGC